MPVLNWIGKNKVINHDKDLPFKVLKSNKKLSGGSGSENVLIEGDNLEALKALMPFYFNKIDFVYIDPPYNTGNEKWVYNDKVNSPQIKSWINKVVGKEGEDLCRHDKWLCMMYPRLKLIKELMSDQGVIFVSIDDNELHNLTEIMDDIFQGNHIATLIHKNNSSKNQANLVSVSTEYVLLYKKTQDGLKGKKWKVEKKGVRDIVRLFDKLKDKGLSLEEIDSQVKEMYSRPKYAHLSRWNKVDERGVFKDADLSRQGGPKNYTIINPETRKKCKIPDRGWGKSHEELLRLQKEDLIWYGDEKTPPGMKDYLSSDKVSVPDSFLYYDNSVDTRMIKKIFGKLAFENPKPLEMIKQFIKMATEDNSIILDSFAGSGTTGHAVLEVNKETAGNRKFILIELENNIAKTITTKRLKAAINGIEGSNYPEGTGQGFNYLELNGELYDHSGFINSDAKYEDLAAYIYFTETKSYLDLSLIKNPYIGSKSNTSYFLFFEAKGKNILNEQALKKTNKYKGNRVIYADKCLLDEDTLEKQGVIFKQIPYELKKY